MMRGSFLVNTVGRALSISRWEMPRYHRSPHGNLVRQKFLTPSNGEILLHASQLELLRRDEMLSKHVSQPDLPKFVSAHVERFRPQLDYDYSQPPHPGPSTMRSGMAYNGIWRTRGFPRCGTHCLGVLVAVHNRDSRGSAGVPRSAAIVRTTPEFNRAVLLCDIQINRDSCPGE